MPEKMTLDRCPCGGEVRRDYDFNPYTGRERHSIVCGACGKTLAHADEKFLHSVWNRALGREAKGASAAAPELAMCLEAMLKITCGTCEGGDGRCVTADGFDACLVARQAKAVLAKAKGE